jgi:hypothetical protein
MKNKEQQEKNNGAYLLTNSGVSGNRVQFVVDRQTKFTLDPDTDKQVEVEGDVHLNAMTGEMSFRSEEVLDVKPATKKNLNKLLSYLEIFITP